MNKKVIKELKSWGVVLAIFLTLYFTGLHTDVAAFAQRMILYTGLLSPNTELEEPLDERVNYNFNLKDLQGNVVSFSEFKDKVVFVNLWASWCPPCIAEMPSIQSLYDKVDQNDVVFVMISLDKDPERAKKFIEKRDFSFPVYTTMGTLPRAFRPGSIPTTLVLSKEGKIVSKKVGMANYDKKSFLKFLQKQVSG